MKVLFISSGNAKYGLTPIVKNQGDTLIRSGVDLDFFCIRGKGFSSYLKHVFILRQYLKTNVYDLYHAHYSLSAFTAAIAGCKPLVVSLMGSDTKVNLLGKSLIHLFSLLSWEIVILKSLPMKKTSGIKKALIIPNGVDLDKVKPEIRGSTKSNVKTVLFAADPGRYAKNFKLARKSVDLIGDDNIILKVVHSKPHSEIIREINNADVLLTTSHWEGSPNIVKEAMACNCVVVSTDVGDIQWLFGDEPGYFITSLESEDVAEKIKLALEFSEKYGRTNGRQRIIKLKLDSETISKRIVGVYMEVLKSKENHKIRKGTNQQSII